MHACAATQAHKLNVNWSRDWRNAYAPYTHPLQVYEDTAGLTVGDGVERTGKPLSVELGPGLLSTIFDGIQRPLKQIAINSGDVFIPRGVDVPALDRKKAYEFKPSKVKVSCLMIPLLLYTCRPCLCTIWVSCRILDVPWMRRTCPREQVRAQGLNVARVYASNLS